MQSVQCSAGLATGRHARRLRPEFARFRDLPPSGVFIWTRDVRTASYNSEARLVRRDARVAAAPGGPAAPRDLVQPCARDGVPPMYKQHPLLLQFAIQRSIKGCFATPGYYIARTPPSNLNWLLIFKLEDWTTLWGSFVCGWKGLGLQLIVTQNLRIGTKCNFALSCLNISYTQSTRTLPSHEHDLATAG